MRQAYPLWCHIVCHAHRVRHFRCPVQVVLSSGRVTALDDAVASAFAALAAIAPAVDAMEAAMRACAAEDEAAAPGTTAVAAWGACATAMFRGSAELQVLTDRVATAERDAGEAERQARSRPLGSGVSISRAWLE